MGGKEEKKKTPTKENPLYNLLPVCEQSVAEHDTLLVERVSVYVWFIVVREALVHQVFLDHTSDPLSHGDRATTQRLHPIPHHLHSGHIKYTAFISRSKIWLHYHNISLAFMEYIRLDGSSHRFPQRKRQRGLLSHRRSPSAVSRSPRSRPRRSP